jgi:hypothetical protein
MGRNQMKNLCSKSRDVNDPYEVWENAQAGFEWRVLKKYQRPDKEAENPHARWFVAAKSPYTYGSFEYGDTYVKDIMDYGVRIK